MDDFELAMRDVEDAKKLLREAWARAREAVLHLDDGHVPEINGTSTDCYVRGGWDDVEFAFQRGEITYAEYAELFEHRQGA